MNKKLNFILLPTLVLLMLFPAALAAEWQTVATFAGPSSQTTNYFSIPTNEWLINWSYTLNEAFPDSTSFSVYVYTKGNDTTVASFKSSAFSAGAHSGIFSIHEGSKEYYLKITSANTPTYNVIVQYTSSSPTPLSTSTPTLVPATTPYSSRNPTPTPTIPELQTWIIMPLLAIMILILIVFFRKTMPEK